ncbi:MAG TPA: ABC transporter substrate-binding protein [Caulobacteraceae bacterium]|nr:ABC transporter substrate-binding protein [Caulobacteraceae bacterium]
MKKTMVAGLLAGAALGLAAPPLAPAAAASADPAAAQVDGFDSALLGAMKAGKAAGVQGRYRALAPAVSRAFDIPTMIRFAVGPTWSSLPAAQQQSLTDAFERLTVASYAHNFDSFSGERFEVDPNVVTRGPDKVVQSKIIPPGAAPVVIAYRMRQNGGAWKIIDVFYNGSISQLTTRRSDFSATLAHGGAPALIAHLNALADKQLK